MILDWVFKPFHLLTPHELYACLQLRSAVFVVEQNCVFLDADGKDEESLHLMGWSDNTLMAYTRIVPSGVIYKEASIGRVITSLAARRSGAGKALMTQSIKELYALFGAVPVKLGAQLYLKAFYQSFGFRQISDVYLEDAIEHIYMLKDAPPVA